MRRLIMLAILACAWSPGPASAQESAPEDLVVVAEGMAALGSDATAGEEEAVWDAKRNAVEQAAGIFLRARAIGRDFELAEDEIDARSAGFIRRWEIVPGSRRIERLDGGKTLRLKIRATVALLPVIRRLSDIADVYADLERPRIRVEVAGDGPAHPAQAALIAALREQGFEVTTGGTAEVTLSGRLETLPAVRLGDRQSPYGVGEVIAACRARLTARLLSSASEETLLSVVAEGTGRSFVSNADAASEAAREAADALLREKDMQLARSLLVRWARERQEGHVIALRVTGLDGRRRALLREQVQAMRGFRRTLAETADTRSYMLRFLTRLDTRAVRRRLAALRLNNVMLTVLNTRGPAILCAALHRPRVSRR